MTPLITKETKPLVNNTNRKNKRKQNPQNIISMTSFKVINFIIKEQETYLKKNKNKNKKKIIIIKLNSAHHLITIQKKVEN